MSLTDLLTDTCTIQKRTLDSSGKISKETWAASSTVKCRAMKRGMGRSGADKFQNATSMSVRFALKLGTDVDIRDRISHGSRVYEVIEVVQPHDSSGAHHVIAVCEGVAGAV